MNIKVCGITQLQQIKELDEAGIEFVGLNFYEESSRYMVGKISPADMQNGDLDIRKVGVFVDEDMTKVMKAVREYTLDIVQLNGNESP